MHSVKFYCRYAGLTAPLVSRFHQQLITALLLQLLLQSSALIQQYQFVPLVQQKFRSSQSAIVSVSTTKSKILCSTQCAATPSCDLLSYSALLRRCEMYSFSKAGLQYDFVADAQWDTLLRTMASDVTASLTGVYQSTPSLRILSGQSELAANYSFSGVLSPQTCRAICETLTDGCSIFSYNALTGGCLIFFIDFYDDWTRVDSSEPGWTGYYKLNANKQKLLFKINSGTGVDLSGKFVTSGVATSFASRMQMAANNTCGGCWLKSDVLEKWSLFGITKISVHFFLAGLDKAFVDLDTVGANVTTFFTQSRLRDSTWTDLTTTTAGVTFGMGDGITNQGRNFYSQQVKSCNDDQCWFAVNGVSATSCVAYTTLRTYPQLGYVGRATKDACNHMAWADTLMVYGTL